MNVRGRDAFTESTQIAVDQIVETARRPGCQGFPCRPSLKLAKADRGYRLTQWYQAE